MAIKSGFSSEDLARMGPDPLTRRRMIAEAMLADASRQRKIDHPLQGMAQLAQALVGGLQQRKFDRAEMEGRNSASATMNELGAALAGPSAFPPAPTGSGSGSGPSTDYPSQRVAQAFGDTNASPSPAGVSGAADWLSYANQGATRNQPLNEKLVSALSFLPDMGVSMKVFSGGQPSEGPNRVGSHRHDHGGAGDAFFYKDGRQLDWANANDRPIFEEIVRRGRAAGVTGFGAGDGYMQPGSMHIGFGNPGVWGAGGKGENAPDWLRSAFAQETSPRAPVQVASNDPRAAMAAALTGGAAAPLPSRNIPDRPIAQMAQAADPYNSETLGATPIPQSGPDMQMLMGAMNNQWLSPAQRSLVEGLIGQKMQANDPAAQLDMDYKRAQIEALRAKPDKLPDSVRALNIRAEQAGLKPGTPEYNQFMVSGGTGPQTIVTTGSNTSEFVKKSDEAAAKRMDEIVSSGQTAPQTMADMQQLVDLGATIGTGQGANIKAKLGPYAHALGIDIENLGDIQAYEAITSRLAPQMRATGSGSSSDRDVSMFLQSLPNLRNLPQGNEIIANTMKAVAQNKINAADIASQAQRGDITWQDADKKIRELPNPYDLFKEFQKQGAKKTVIDGYTIEQVD